ncbi:kynurenine formamidase isoform X2 [Fopius arisanus]|uniref:Kynurenine formamidase isoform X2 n=1 Tax=Fopius arisanus TaxID=64838 RepID=A0A9R1UBA1_9HYME|nr:PREDICTED: kynurenine formamidase isoform X2 [Fopius arisanus]
MSFNPELEKLYSPSMWSRRYGSAELISKFVELSHKVVDEARKTIPCQIDIPYGSSERMKYDIYGTNLSNDAPVVIFIHGGYYQEGSKETIGFGIPSLVAQGIKVILLGYDLCPAVKLADIVGQIKVATTEILTISKKNEATNVWIVGHSAGAHLAASLLHDVEWRARMAERNLLPLLKGIALFGGIYHLRDILDLSTNAVLQLTEEEIKKYSFNDLDTTELTPVEGINVIVGVGECDSPEFIQSSKHYAQEQH